MKQGLVIPPKDWEISPEWILYIKHLFWYLNRKEYLNAVKENTEKWLVSFHKIRFQFSFGFPLPWNQLGLSLTIHVAQAHSCCNVLYQHIHEGTQEKYLGEKTHKEEEIIYCLLGTTFFLLLFIFINQLFYFFNKLYSHEAPTVFPVLLWDQRTRMWKQSK